MTTSSADDVRAAFAHYPSGVAALAARVDGEDHVLVASSFTVGVSMDPVLVMFAVQHSSTTWPTLRRAERIGVSVLSADQGVLCRQLSSKDKTARWGGVETQVLDGGAIVVDEASLSLECEIHAEFAAGDHDVVVLRVHELTARHDLDPLVFHGSRFRAIR